MLSVSGMVLWTLLAASSNVLPEEMALTTPPDVLPRKYVEYPKISDCAKMLPPKLLVVKTVIVAAWAGVASKSAESSSSFFTGHLLCPHPRWYQRRLATFVAICP